MASLQSDPLVQLRTLYAFFNSMSYRSKSSSTSCEDENGVPIQWPETLDGFGYHFVEGVLRNMETGKRFETNWTKGGCAQRQYAALGEVITRHVFDLLVSEGGLTKIQIPADAENGDPQGFFFASEDAWNCDKLVLLIHGSGTVRAGQWSRKLIISQSLESGTQLPYIKRCKDLGYGVVVLNTNQTKGANAEGKQLFIRYCEDPISHAQYVWEEFIGRAKASKIAIVAHSAGGYTTIRLADIIGEDFMDRVVSISLLDSAHLASLKDESWTHIKQIAVNYVCSGKPLSEPVTGAYHSEIVQLSAGTTKHDETPSCAIEAVFARIVRGFDS